MTVPTLVMRSTIGAARIASPRLSARAAGAALASNSRRGMVSFEEREKGEEQVYMRKEEQKLLKKLLEKTHAKESNAREELMDILGSHKLPKDIMDKILYWKTH